MRVGGADSTGGTDPNANVDANSTSQTSTQDGSSTFAKVLAKKQAQDNSPFDSSKNSKGDLDPTLATPLATPGPSDRGIDTPAVEDKHIVSLPPDLEQLVHEISVVVNAPGQQQVHVELNSTVLKGLQIRIDRQQGGVAIQFQSSSDEVARLLSKNVDALTQGLADRGVNLADVHIAGPQQTDRGQTSKNQFAGNVRWQGAGGQGRR
jgi:Flagellar hook-length control protein FliK